MIGANADRPTLRVRATALAASTLAVATLIVAAAAPARAAERIAEVWVKGNQRVESSAIRVNVSMKPGDPYDVRKINTDVREIFSMGFFEDVWVTAERRDDGLVLAYNVSERPYVQEILFEGARKVTEEDLEAVINVTPRTIFDPQRVWQGLEQARKLYGGEGYPDAQIDYRLDTDDDNNATLVYTIDEGELVRVAAIRFEGVKAFKERQLRKLMTTREKWFLSFATGAGLLNEDELSTDVERLTAFYYDQGYVEASIDEPRVERTEDGLEITIKVSEGKLFYVGDVSFQGDLLLTDEQLRRRAGMKTGDVFRASLLREAVFALTDAYGDLGYAFAQISPETKPKDFDADRVDVRFQIESGDVVKIRRIEIRGNTKTRDHVIRRELDMEEGDEYSGSALRRGKSDIRRLGFFDEVELSTNRTENEDEIDLLVQIKEGRTGAFSAGAGFSSADSLLFNARISEQNLFGRAQRLVFNADFGTVRQNFQVGFTEPWFGNRPLAVGFDIFDWSLEFDRFTRGGTGIGLRASYPLVELGLSSLGPLSLDHVRAGLEYRLEQSEIDGLGRFTPPDVTESEDSILTSSLTPTLVRNTLDHPFDPTSGSRQILSGKFAGFGSDTDFFKLEASGRWFFPLGKLWGGRQLVYSVGGRLGFGLGQSQTFGRLGDKNNVSGSKELPVFERYFPGGINSVRGFDSREMGPKQRACDSQEIEDDDCPLEQIGGSQLLVMNQELIFPLAPGAGIKGVLFFDAGEAFLAEEGYDLGQLNYAAGWGIRWLSPFGPLRVEVGYNLDPEEDEDSSVVLFSFGSPF